MRSYSVLPHTADIRLMLRADTVEELLLAGLSGMAHILKADFCTAARVLHVQRHLRLTSTDPTALLVDFLSDALTEAHLARAVFCTAVIHQLDAQTADITIHGAEVTAFDEDIKAVTYHEADIRQGPDGRWSSMIIFDI